LRVRRSDDGKRAVTIRCDGTMLDVEGVKVSLKRADEKAPLTLHLFLDKSVMEVFVNGGRACVTRVIYPGEEDKAVEVFAEGGTAILESLESWELSPIW
jgi:beta-fructofuranosidase